MQLSLLRVQLFPELYECSVTEVVELITYIHTVTSDVRINICYVQAEGRFPGEGEGGV